ncbi:MAG: TerB family tellurite resistance protein [Pikeienuella sp.]
MSIWERIRKVAAALRAGEPLSALFERIGQEPEKTVAFTIAVIALGAKMAKADGRVTRDEIMAFRQIFRIQPKDELAAARVYNTARLDVAGFEFYARRVARMFHDRPSVLNDLLEALIYIAMADGEYHPSEAVFLQEVARIFGISDAAFATIRARHMPEGADPYRVIGVGPEADDDTIRRVYRRAVRELHPDQMIARGLPEEAMRLAEKRLAKINAAYEQIKRERAAVG